MTGGSTVLRGTGAFGALRVQRLRMDDSEVAATWRRLQAAGGVDTPFLTWEWNAGFADAPGACERVEVLMASRSGQPIGLLPVEWSRADGRWTTIGPAGWRWLSPDHLDVVAEATDRTEAAHAFARELSAAGDWDVADFQGFAGDSAMPEALRLHLRRPRFLRVCEQSACPTVALAGKSEQELLPSRNLRQQVRRGLRAAEARGGGLEVVCEPEAVTGLLEHLMSLHNARFGAASAVFASPARRRFHALAASRLAAAGMARIYRLRSGERDAGLLYALVLGPRIFYYSMGIAPSETLSPGRTVLGQAILHAAAEGFTEFDLLRGDHDFKLRFSDGARTDERVGALRLTPRTVLLAAPSLARRAWRRLRSRTA